jgi:Sec-independent protein translocase protein TatA
MVAVVLIVVVGPKHLPKLMNNIGKTLRGLRRATDDLKSTIGYSDMMRAVDMRKDLSLKTPPKKAARVDHGAAQYHLTAADKEREHPTGGVDAHFAKLSEEQEPAVVDKPSPDAETMGITPSPSPADASAPVPDAFE